MSCWSHPELGLVWDVSVQSQNLLGEHTAAEGGDVARTGGLGDAVTPKVRRRL